MNGNKKNPFLFWFLVWGLGIAGQICWNMENQWFYNLTSISPYTIESE